MAAEMRDFSFDGRFRGRNAPLRGPSLAGRNECGKQFVIPSPDAALGDGDTAARFPYPGLPSSKFTTYKAGNVTAATSGRIYDAGWFVPR